MIVKELKIKKNQWLSDVLPMIPTNTILNKVMTGCGATTLEINAPRHSIIIEPNVPVIIGKKNQHPFLFAVYEGTTKEDVKAYLSGEEDGYRKIITTPEIRQEGASRHAGIIHPRLRRILPPVR